MAVDKNNFLQDCSMKIVIQVSKVIIFIFLFSVIWFYIDSVLKPKFFDGIEPLTEFYRFPRQSIDVAFFGSSHMEFSINPVIIWQEKGIPSYVLSGSIQPLWNSYYYIKECLKYQSPKVIVLEGFTSAVDVELDWSRIVKNNIGLKMSKDKIESIMVSAPKINWLELIIGLPVYHMRYKELTKRDFVDPYIRGEKAYNNGFYTFDKIVPQLRPDVAGITSLRDIPEKQFKYLNKIIDLAKSKNIELLFVITPYVLSSIEQERFNCLHKLAKENNIKFINYNLLYEKVGLDFSSDFLDSQHLNINGSRKISKHLASILFTEYRLEDKRQNPDYAKWNSMV
jgi:hypothetical protein